MDPSQIAVLDNLIIALVALLFAGTGLLVALASYFWERKLDGIEKKMGERLSRLEGLAERGNGVASHSGMPLSSPEHNAPLYQRWQESPRRHPTKNR